MRHWQNLAGVPRSRGISTVLQRAEGPGGCPPEWPLLLRSEGGRHLLEDSNFWALAQLRPHPMEGLRVCVPSQEGCPGMLGAW